MQNPTILTIVLNYRTPELAFQAAQAALREMEGLGGEIIIVDNDSQDSSYERLCNCVVNAGLQTDNRVRVLQSGRNGGFGAGNNFGINAGLSSGDRPDYVYILNSDAWPEPGAIQHLRDVLLANPRVGMAGSFVRGPDGDAHQTAFRFPSIAGEFEMAARTGVFSRLLKNSIVALPIPEQETPVDWVAGASLMMRRQMLDEIGQFDETFFLYFEETDLCLRAKRAGWQVHYVPKSEVVHIGSASTGMKLWKRTPAYWFQSRMYYFSKNHGRFYAGAATAARIAGAVIWKLRGLVSQKPQADPDGFLGDLTRHAFGSAIASAPRTALPQTVIEDRK
ncbi:MAG: glycosyltransferase [Sedimentitalea sp.]